MGQEPSELVGKAPSVPWVRGRQLAEQKDSLIGRRVSASRAWASLDQLLLSPGVMATLFCRHGVSWVGALSEPVGQGQKARLWRVPVLWAGSASWDCGATSFPFSCAHKVTTRSPGPTASGALNAKK